MAIFPTFFFTQYRPRKCLLDILEGKNVFKVIKTRSLKSQKIDIFPKGLTHGFRPKMAIIPTFFLGKIGQENVFYDILERKNAFLTYKKKVQKVKKLKFFQMG